MDWLLSIFVAMKKRTERVKLSILTIVHKESYMLADIGCQRFIIILLKELVMNSSIKLWNNNI